MSVMDKCLYKQFCMNKYKKVSRSVRAKTCLIKFQAEVFEAYTVLKTLSLKFVIDLPETDFEGYEFCNHW